MSPRPLPGQAVPHITARNSGTRPYDPSLSRHTPRPARAAAAPISPQLVGAAACPNYFTGFHTLQPSDVNCPSELRIVTVIDWADDAKLLSMMSPASEVRSQ